MDYKNYSYFKGEKKCPFTDIGRAFWWQLEAEAARHGDAKLKGEMSPTMLSFIKERVWQSRSGWSTTWVEARRRAEDCYAHGHWNAGYISDKDAPRSIVK